MSHPNLCPACGANLGGRSLNAICPGCLFGAESEPGPGSVVAGHQLLELIGRGGMGTVFRARHLRLDREVALKLLATHTPGLYERLQREAQALARLDHPGIVRIHDYGEHEGDPFLSMELVEGVSVAAKLEDGPLPVEEVKRIACAVCRALAAAHSAGVVHRDVKPSNVLLSDDGRVLLCDFGIARLSDRDGLTGTDQVVGTPGYMAPEQLVAGSQVDQRTDIYAVGALIYQMQTGRVPAGSWERTGTALDPVLIRALRPDPKQRFSSANEMLQALEGPFSSLGFEERVWEFGTALLIAIAAMVAAWTAVSCLTPVVYSRSP